jgi:hypothetical protein
MFTLFHKNNRKSEKLAETMRSFDRAEIQNQEAINCLLCVLAQKAEKVHHFKTNGIIFNSVGNSKE